MTIFIDASALVAMIAREPEAVTFADRLLMEADKITSAVAIWEGVRAVSRARNIDYAEARRLLQDFLREASIRIVPIGEEEAELALDAHARFGKGVHPAQLNMGDCFAYACACRHGGVILFKGADFAQTNLKDATLT